MVQGVVHAHGEIEQESVHGSLFGVFHHLFGQAGSFHRVFDDLRIVDGDAELLGDQFSYGASAAGVLPADRDDLIHAFFRILLFLLRAYNSRIKKRDMRLQAISPLLRFPCAGFDCTD